MRIWCDLDSDDFKLTHSETVCVICASGSVLCHQNCSYQRIIHHLGLTSDRDLFTLSRPVKNATEPLVVYVNFRPELILDVVRTRVFF